MRLQSENKEKYLLKRLKKNDHQAFEVIFDTYKGKLYHFIHNSLPLEEDAESVVQEIFVKLWLSREKIDDEKSLNAYLFTIARNQIYDHLRKLLQKRKYMKFLVTNYSSASVQNEIEYWEFEKYLHEHIEKLPEKRRKIYILSKIQGLSYREIAGRLNISENTVDMQMRKANAVIKEAIMQYLSLFLFWLINH